VFSIRDREALRNRLIAAARADHRITAAAVVGSEAIDGEDAWSDIDLALRLADGLEPDNVAADWTTRIYESAGAVDHVDVWSGSTLFRVFLLSNSLQVDLSFWTADTSAASAASFHLLFGESNEPRSASEPRGDARARAGRTRAAPGLRRVRRCPARRGSAARPGPRAAAS
jgi:hypothetical protein